MVHRSELHHSAGRYRDTCHDLMISEPALLAEILIDRCRLQSRAARPTQSGNV
jgi:hypothetical protein